MRIKNQEQLQLVVAQVLKYAHPNTCLLLNGPIGAGKTTFSKLLLAALGVQEVVSSPTFIIMNQYQGREFNINHIDAYRLSNAEESEMYLEQFFDAFNVIEWGQNLQLNLEKYFKVVEVTITVLGETVREFEIKELN